MNFAYSFSCYSTCNSQSGQFLYMVYCHSGHETVSLQIASKKLIKIKIRFWGQVESGQMEWEQMEWGQAEATVIIISVKWSVKYVRHCKINIRQLDFTIHKVTRH